MSIIMILQACAVPLRSGADNVIVTADNSGARIELKRPQLLSVRLPSNPSTGFTWSLVDINPDVLKLKGDGARFEPDRSGAGLLGAGGTEVWEFKPVAEGDTVVRFEYRRPWEHGIEPIQTAMYTVRIR
ncbi:MAG: protease inhibitor I42 family protein [Methylococcaceae bacterium]